MPSFRITSRSRSAMQVDLKILARELRGGSGEYGKMRNGISCKGRRHCPLPRGDTRAGARLCVSRSASGCCKTISSSNRAVIYGSRREIRRDDCPAISRSCDPTSA